MLLSIQICNRERKVDAESQPAQADSSVEIIMSFLRNSGLEVSLDEITQTLEEVGDPDIAAMQIVERHSNMVDQGGSIESPFVFEQMQPPPEF